jgi:putative hydrolase of the HAD superfamily
MVGDNFEWDVAQPQRLGITGVWVNPLGSQVPDKACLEPHFVVGSIAELPGLLQRAREQAAVLNGGRSRIREVNYITVRPPQVSRRR